MPRIDPLQLLNCLNVLLTPKGGIKSEQEVARISSLMEKFSKKLVSKCVYLLILKNSDPHLLFKFMGLGGWNLIYNWLVHAVEAKNYPFLIELLEVILICPVDIERLKSNPMPRQVKALSRDPMVDAKVRDLASDIVKHWLAIVKSTPPVTAPVATGNSAATPPAEAEKPKEEQPSFVANRVNEIQISSEAPAGGEEEDETYTKSTSPSSSSLDSDDSDVFVPYKKSQTKLKKRTVPKKEKSPIRKSTPEEKRKLKSKLISTSVPKGDKPGSIKMKIEVSSNSSSSESKPKKSAEKTIEEKLKEKRKMKEEKEKEKFARFKQEREKKEKHRDREKHDTDIKQRDKLLDEKLKGELSKLIPKPLDKLGRIPKINKDKEKEKENAAISGEKRKEEKKHDEKKPEKKEEKPSNLVKEADKNKEKDLKKDKEGKKIPVPPPKKPVSISVEKRSAGEVKPKTVKAYNSKFRLTGLEQEVIPKPAVRKMSNLSSSSPTSTSSGYDKIAVKRSPPKDVENEPVEKKLKSPDVSFTEEKLSPGQIKSNKKPFLQESDSFMNAMDIALLSQKEQLRKRKKPAQKSDAEGKGDEAPVVGRKNSDVSSPTVKAEPGEVKPAFKFYKDTLETSVEESADTTENNVEKNPLVVKPESTEDEKVKENLPVSEPMVPKSAVGLKSSLAIFRARKNVKKSVTWKSDTELEAVQYFEVDATERTNVVRNFWEMQMMERTKERDMMMVRKIGENDKMSVQTKWKPLIPIDLTPPTTVRGVNSQEKNIQYARERAVPPSLYYNKSMIPDTPAEPDLEIHPVTVPPIIPLDDISGSQDSVNDFSDRKWPEPKQFPPDNIDMNMMKGFMAAAGMPPPIFPPFPDGSFPPPFGQPFFPGGTVPPLPVPPNTWNATSTESNQQASSTSTTIPWVPPGVVPPPGMIGPPPFGMLGPFPPIPGAGFPPNLFPMNSGTTATEDTTSVTNSDSHQFSNTSYSTSGNNDTNGGGSGSVGGGGGGNNSNNSGGVSDRKKWTNDDRYYSKKDNWRNNYNERNRDKRGSSNWRGSGGNSRLCRIFQKKGYCSVPGCRFYHPDKN